MLTQGYARTYRSNAVLTASPGQLVLMLYDGCLRNLAQAREALGRPEDDVARIQVINTQLLKAQAIISELQSGLNFEAGGEIATTLNRVYDYYNRRLFEANLRKQVAPVIEVERLIGELRDGWAEMLAKQGSGRPAEAVRGVA
jgi:flagellar protein FliS